MPQPTQIAQSIANDDAGPDNVDALVSSLPGPGAQQPVQQAASTATPAQTPALAPAADPIVEFAKSLGYSTEDGEFTREDFRAELERRHQQSELVTKHLGDDFNEERLQQALAAEQRFQSIAPKLTEFEQWQQQQSASAAQQAQTQQAAKLRWAPIPEPTQEDFGLVEQDPRAPNRVKAKSPEWTASADRVNALLSRKSEMDRLQATNPEAFFREAYGLDPNEIRSLRNEFNEFKAWKQQQSTEAQAATELQRLYDENIDLFAPANESGQREHGPALQAFNEEYSRALQANVPEPYAREVAMRFAKATVAIPTTQTAGALPQRQPPQHRPPGSGRKVIARQPRATDVTGGGAGSAALPMTDRPEPESIDAMVEMSGQLATAQVGR